MSAAGPGPGAAVAPDAVITHHRDGFRSGVARFNELLAHELGVPLHPLDAASLALPRQPLLSFKVSELGAPERALLEQLAGRAGAAWELFLHELCSDPLEDALVRGAVRVVAGNHEIAARLAAVRHDVQVAWTPGLLLDDRCFRPAEISIFSFGMAHKLRLDMFRKLRALLDAGGRSYVVYVSAANHETASLRDSQSVFEEMHEIFPEELFFLGNLSDVAVAHYLRECTFYAAFFGGGVRANNTSVASAMERGAVVVTNLDEHSPPELEHLRNVIDIGHCDRLPDDPLVLKQLSVAAMETGRGRSWQGLARVLRG